MIDDGRDELGMRIARLRREHDPLEAQYALALQDLSSAKRAGRETDIERASRITEVARLALNQCEEELRLLERELAAIMAADDGT